MIGCTTEIDFFLWPRRDLEKIECKLFSRWKGDVDAPYKPLLVSIHLFVGSYIIVSQVSINIHALES